MTSVLIILGLALFATGISTAFDFLSPLKNKCRADAKVELDKDKADIKRHHDNLLQQAQPVINEYIGVRQTVLNPVLMEFGDAASEAWQILSPLSRSNLDVNGDCRRMVDDFVNELRNAANQVGKCWTKGGSRVNNAGRQLKARYVEEMDYLEGYKSTVDSLGCVELFGKIVPFANRKKDKLQRLTATCDNLVREIITETGNLSKCVRENKEYGEFERYSDGILRSIESCVNEKLKSISVRRPSADSTGGLEIPLYPFSNIDSSRA